MLLNQSFLNKKHREQLQALGSKLRIEILETFNLNKAEAEKSLSEWKYVTISYFFLKKMLKERNLKNH